MPTETDLIRIARYRSSGYGGMVETEFGLWVRHEDVRDLLAAAKRSLDWLSSYPGNGAHSAYQQMRDAIAKAEGR